ncbi:MAG: nitroreductase/quinone reductase family protein [Gammaproteobacteria bacterium]|nr:nitroreductase/quinone reductase family protein [Gammaproteobacteria bacterium]
MQDPAEAPLQDTDVAGLPKLVLITHGRYSGRSEATLLIYRRRGNDYIVIATNERRKAKPDWYLNLKEEPIVQIEIGDASFYAKATTPTGRERVQLLEVVADMMNGYDTSIPRETSAVVLSPMG